EVFTQPNPRTPEDLSELCRFLQGVFLAADHRPQGRLILGFRKEWLSEVERQLSDHRLPRTRLDLGPLDEAGGRARGRPAPEVRGQYQLTVEDGLAEAVARVLVLDQGSAVAPALQVLLSAMWDTSAGRGSGRPELSLALFQELRDQRIALDDFLKK